MKHNFSLYNINSLKRHVQDYVFGNLSKHEFEKICHNLGVYDKNTDDCTVNIISHNEFISKKDLYNLYKISDLNNLNYIEFTKNNTIKLHGINISNLINIINSFPNDKFSFNFTPTLFHTHIFTLNSSINDYKYRNSKFNHEPNTVLYSVHINPIDNMLSIDKLKSILYLLDKIKSPILKLDSNSGVHVMNLTCSEANKMLSFTKDL